MIARRCICSKLKNLSRNSTNSQWFTSQGPKMHKPTPRQNLPAQLKHPQLVISPGRCFLILALTSWSMPSADQRRGWNHPLNTSRNQTLPQDEGQAKTLQRKAGWFKLHEGTLYKKSYTHPLLKCVSPEEGVYILREIHEGGCEIHQGVRTVISKVLRSGYYWPSLRSDVEVLVKRCPQCQYHSKIGRKPFN